MCISILTKNEKGSEWWRTEFDHVYTIYTFTLSLALSEYKQYRSIPRREATHLYGHSALPDFKLIPNYEPITDWGPYYHWAQRADVQNNLNIIKEMVSGNWPWGASANLELKDGELRVWGKITL